MSLTTSDAHTELDALCARGLDWAVDPSRFLPDPAAAREGGEEEERRRLADRVDEREVAVDLEYAVHAMQIEDDLATLRRSC